MLRWLWLVPAIAVFGALAFLTHGYVVERMVREAGLAEPLATWLGAGVWFGLALIVAQPLAERLAPRAVGRAVAVPAYLWMGVLFLLIVALAASDAVLALGVRAAHAAGAVATATPAVGAERAAVVATVVLAAAALGVRNALRGPRDVRVELVLARWPRELDGYRIVQVSDVHIGPMLGARFAREIARRVNALAPDLVAVTGDLVDGRADHLADEVAPLAALRARDGVFFVTGNHDFYSGADVWSRRVEELGMRALRNEAVLVERAGARFALAGVDDHRAAMLPGEGGEDLDRALEGVSPSDALVLLAHDPSTFARAHAMGVDLQLSGHTHGGQIWPFRWLVRLAVPFVEGVHRRGAAQLYVSRGTGFWGPPMRLGAPAEITELVLRAPAAGSGARAAGN
ncbi:MAG: metallophosphoesterase [Myxococcota bacterium]